MSGNVSVWSRNPLIRPGDFTDEKGRDYYFDNAKLLLILLVVIGHFIEPIRDNGNVLATYLWRVINTLHMPCMIFISGYFAKSYINRATGKVNIQRLFNYVVIYIAAQLVTAAALLVVEKSISPSILLPRSALWYLQCLVLWHLVLPLLDRIEPKYVMIGSVIVGLLIGYDKEVGGFMSISRAFSHLPFFMAGYYISKDTISKLFTRKAKLLAIPAAAVVLTVFVFLLPYNMNALPGSKTNYWNLSFLSEVTPWLWWAARLFSYISSVLLCFAFLAFVPRCWTCLTGFGSRTLQVYILHRFPAMAIAAFGWWKPFDSSWGIAAMTGIAVLTGIVLSLKPFWYPFKWLQSIKIEPLLRKEPKKS